MKKASEYINSQEYTEWDDLLEGHRYLHISKLNSLIKQIQEEAIRETVQECANSAEMEWDFVHGASIDKNSILSIADKLMKEL